MTQNHKAHNSMTISRANLAGIPGATLYGLQEPQAIPDITLFKRMTFLWARSFSAPSPTLLRTEHSMGSQRPNTRLSEFTQRDPEPRAVLQNLKNF